METVQEPSTDALASLEDRITRAVHIITDLRSQNAQLAKHVSGLEEELKQAQASKDRIESSASDLQRDRAELEQKANRLTQEVEEMRGERKQVRSRIEKLLTQLDLLSAS